MDSGLVAVALTYGPRRKIAAWQQEAMANVLERWEVERSEDFERVLYNRDSAWLIEITPKATGLGQYGWDTEFVLEVGIDDDLYEQTDNGAAYRAALEDYCEALKHELCAVVQIQQEYSPFSEKEFVAFLLYQDDTIQERQAADALEVTVGTYRGKLGRIRTKIEGAKLTLDLMGKKIVDRDDDEQRPGAYGDLVNVFEADEYPVSGIRRDDILYVVRNFIDVHDHQHGETTYDTVVEGIREKVDEEISYHRARYELERAIKRGDVERDGELVTVAE